ncbi:MAG: response regulator [SAR324 cluster bacterium]|nr:response regulator [SAR324 cluster bacterium]
MDATLDKYIQLLKASRYCSNQTEETLLQIINLGQIIHYFPDEDVYCEDEPLTDLFILLSGSASVIRQGCSIMELSDSGMMIGEEQLFEQGLTEHTILAKTSLQCLKLSLPYLQTEVSHEWVDRTFLKWGILSHQDKMKMLTEKNLEYVKHVEILQRYESTFIDSAKNIHGNKFWKETSAASHSKNLQSAIQFHIEFEKLITQISIQFINVEMEKIDESIVDVLEKIGMFIHAEQMHMARFDDSGIRNFFEWHNAKVSPAFQDQSWIEDNLDWIKNELEQLGNFEIPIFTQKPITLDDEEDFPVKSLIAVSMKRSGDVVGFISFDSFYTWDTWLQEDLALLQIIGEVFLNVLERKEWEIKLSHARDIAEQANRNKTEFIANLSHEMRTPLNGIMGFCELAQTSGQLQEIQHYMERILSESRVLKGLINDILDQAKLTVGKLKLDPQPFYLHDLLIDLDESLGTQIRQKKLIYQWQLDETIPEILVGDYGRLRQIFVNLISNAAKFTEQGGIQLRCTLQDDQGTTVVLKFEVEDTGIGIPAEQLDRIFESFTQVDGSLTRKYGGTGLGTTISKALVELMQGQIQVHSVVNRGSSFSFTVCLGKNREGIPVNRHVSIENTDQYELMASQALNVMIVEDYETNQILVVHLLSKIGGHGHTAANGEKALEMFRPGLFDMILMDLQMPVMDGFEATRRIRKIEQQAGHVAVPIIALSAHPYARESSECFAVGMNDFLEKPLSKDKLFMMIKKWIRKETMVESENRLSSENNTVTDTAVNNPTDAASSLEKPIEYNQALLLFEEDKDLLNMVIQQFIDTMDERFLKIEELIRQQDCPAIRNEGHGLKGSARTIAANRLSELALKMEKAGESNNLELAQELLVELRNEQQRLLAFWEAHKASL